jgi:hypothetical protein
MDDYDPIRAALRADAEAAREEIRAAGIICPSCGANMADLPGGHALALYDLPDDAVMGAECAFGSPAILAASFELMRAAANVALHDDFNRQWAEVVRRDIIGTGPGHFTGLLDVLGGEVP